MMARQELERLFDGGRFDEAFAALAQAWHESPDLATALDVISRYERYRSAVVLTPHRVFIARAFAVEPLVPLLRAAAFVNGIDLLVELGGYNAYAAEMLDPLSALYRFEPQTVILAVDCVSVAPRLWDLPAAQGDAARLAADAAFAHLADLIAAFRKFSDAHLVVHSLELPDPTTLGIYGSRTADGEHAAISSINDRLRELTRGCRGVYMLDYDALVARHGRRAWRDERKWERHRIPMAASNMRHTVDEWLRFIHPLAGVVAKVAVTDLDDTLWGGVVGEDGFAGIRMGAELGGSPYRALQRALLALRERGVLLAVCSKNDERDAMDVLERHPDMLLRPEHFAAIRINWEPKSENLRSLAHELNIGLDAIALIDDNPVERAQVRSALPQLRVIELPSEPTRFARTVLDFPLFERLELATEDRARAQYYREQRLRVDLRASLASKEAFFLSLQQRAEITHMTPLTLPRIAQLTQKTNQFNVTTHRYTQEQLSRLTDDPSYAVLAVRVHDRFGDNGLVGVMVTRDEGDACRIETFLLSCRVIGRGIETAMLAWLAHGARTRGRTRLTGAFYPTRKNEPAKGLYRDHRFHLVAQRENGSSWELPLEESVIEVPDWVSVVASQEVPV